MLIGDLEDELLVRFPRSDAEPWDHVGMSVGDPRQEVTGVCCALDATCEAVRAASSLGCNVLLTHHPVYLDAPSCFAPRGDERSTPGGSAVFEAVKAGVSIISLHTNLDRSLEARACLPACMGFEAVSSLEFADDPAAHGLGSLAHAEGTSLLDVAHKAQDAFSTEVQVWGDATAPVRTVAFLGGSLGDFGNAALAAHADAIITGEVGYHRAQELMVRGLSVVLLGHDRSEQPFCRILADAAADAGVPRNSIHIIPLPRQWWTTSQGGNQ